MLYIEYYARKIGGLRESSSSFSTIRPLVRYSVDLAPGEATFRDSEQTMLLHSGFFDLLNFKCCLSASIFVV